ncbi:MAG TPA: IS1 family transposase [Candidatus Acidoferrales bacterium]|nr:IS1 family transposase [Candidatus Acidoferrales bacterium]
MNRSSIEKRAQIVSALVEGNSLRATVRMTGAAMNTVLKLLADVGVACRVYQDAALRHLNCKRIQCDEIWQFCYAKEKNVPEEKRGQFGYGDVWTWVALDADTKLVPCWMIGDRSAGTAYAFIHDLAERLSNRIQLTTDGHKTYLNAVEDAFGSGIDYAMLVKLYGNDAEKEVRYSPAQCIGCQAAAISGRPDPKHISTSFVERQNLTMRMSMRRFTRLTNAFSKKVENLGYAVALHYMWYNFVRIHKTLRVTPAMEAGITDHVWSFEEIVKMAN